MPIYEYVCNHCGERFEKLVLKLASENPAACPYCGSEEVERAVRRLRASAPAHRHRRLWLRDLTPPSAGG